MSPNSKSPSPSQQYERRGRAAEALTNVALVGSPEPTITQQLTALTDLAYLTWVIEHDQRELVKSLRAHGSTWQQIGDALGVTRSAAQQRFSA